MNILVIDTSSKFCSIGIRYRKNKKEKEKEGKDVEYIKIYKTLDKGRTHSETLLILIDEVLKEAKILLKDINILGVVTGPRLFYRY